MKKTLLALALLSIGNVSTATELSFNNFEIGYGVADFDCRQDCDGLGIAGNVEINDHFYIGASYVSAGNRADGGAVGVGYRIPMGDATAFYTELGVSHASAAGYSETDPFVGIGTRSMLSDSFELDGGISANHGDDTDFGAHLTGTWFFNETMGVSLGLGGGEGSFGGDIAFRLNF